MIVWNDLKESRWSFAFCPSSMMRSGVFFSKLCRKRGRAEIPDHYNGQPGAIGGDYSFIVQVWSVHSAKARCRGEGKMNFPPQLFLLLAAGPAALPVASRVARAQAYPSRPVRIVVGF